MCFQTSSFHLFSFSSSLTTFVSYKSGTYAVVRLNMPYPSIILSCAGAINSAVLVYTVRVEYSTPSRAGRGQP